MEDNKIRILKMLENGLITVEEAKDLLETSGIDEKTSTKRNVSVEKAKSFIEENKPKVKGFAISALDKISDFTNTASQRLQNKEYIEDEKKFFVVTDTVDGPEVVELEFDDVIDREK